MMRRLAILGAALCALLVPGVASAHPLGNFTVNHYARLEPSPDAIRVTYVLDMAEIPTFQEGPQLDDLEAYAVRRADAIADQLRLSVEGQPLRLHTDRYAIALPPGAGGLSTLRLEAVYSAPVTWSGSAARLDFQDANDPDRIGWREIVARPGADGVTIETSSVSAADVSDELRTYPDDLLQSPLNAREAHLSIALQPLGQTAAPHGPEAPAPHRTADARASVAALARSGSALVDLASTDRLTPGFIVVALATAMALGMVHALQPGHGKTVVAAYLVGARGTARHALFLGATVTVTHTAGVYALGLVTLFLSQYVVPERLYPILEVVSGVLVIVMGGWVLGQRLRSAANRSPGHTHHGHTHDHDHDHGHDHDHHHGHSHALPERVGWRSLLALGVSGGLLPCPEALLVLLVTIAAHRVLFGLLLIVAFSTGLAGVLVGFGLLLVYARGLFSRVNLSSTALLPRLLPLASAAVIMVAGGVITLQALPRVL